MLTFTFLAAAALVAAAPAPQFSIPSFPSLSIPSLSLPTVGIPSGIPSLSLSGALPSATLTSAALPSASASASSTAVTTSSTSSGTIGDTADDVTNGVCKPVTLIFARGTTESGNMGSVVGPPLANSLIGSLGADQVAVQGIDYPADVTGAITGATDPSGSEGATTCASLVQQALSACSTTKIALGGYSQGAEVVHGCLMNLQAGQVSAAVTFGDPLQSQAFSNIDASKTKVFCASGDGVCDGTFAISAAHLSYGSDGDTDTGAQFIASAVGTTSKSRSLLRRFFSWLP